MKEELNRPLGVGAGRRRVKIDPRLVGGIAVVVVVLAGAAAAGWHFLPAAKGPTAVAVIASPTTRPAATDNIATASLPHVGSAALTDIPTASDSLSGGSAAGDKVTITDPTAPDAPVQLASLPDKNLVEATDKGPLPKVGADGRRPLDAYARPSEANGNDIRIAIVIGGLGLDAAGTKQAIATLPGAVTLAFAPYGNDLASETAAARASGHELLLQVPEEPFNYPKTDPGPNTLTTDATAAINQSRLRWFLGRMTNYVGVTNYMGARFAADQTALAPVMQEIGDRGLLYLDDGSSSRSAAATIAGTSMPFLQADLVLDADLSPEAIDASLKQLQDIARQRGYAIATATAFPITIDRVAAFAGAAADKGITLVPVSALVPHT